MNSYTWSLAEKGRGRPRWLWTCTMTLTSFPQVYFLQHTQGGTGWFLSSSLVAHRQAWFMNYGSVKQVHFFRVASTDLAVMS